MNQTFITGVSSGIGYALAQEFLSRGWRVYGISRRTPAGLGEEDYFTHAAVDLHDHRQTAAALAELLQGIDHLDVAVLNAGVLGQFDDLARVDLEDLKQVMEVNLWANKTVIDALLAGGRTIRQAVAISSGASINGNRGWAGYSLSKAALNVLMKLYAREHGQTHFCAFSPGVIETPLLDKLCGLPSDDRFPSVDAVRGKRNTPEVPTAEEAAGRLIDVFAKLPELVASGDYADIRQLPAV